MTVDRERHGPRPQQAPAFRLLLYAAALLAIAACNRGETPEVDESPNRLATGAMAEGDPTIGLEPESTADDSETDAVDACQTNEDCSAAEYCARPEGICDGPGVCEPRPEMCTMNFDPVCGCDGRSWSNACDAASNGANVAHPGECDGDASTATGAVEGEPCGGPAQIPCVEGLVCDRSEATTCDQPIGACTAPTDVICTQDWRPVCGCDGETYGNDCARAAAYAAKAHDGACPGTDAPGQPNVR